LNCTDAGNCAEYGPPGTATGGVLSTFTVNALVSDGVSPPVTTLTVTPPTVAEFAIKMLAVALVELVTVTGPFVPAE